MKTQTKIFWSTCGLLVLLLAVSFAWPLATPSQQDTELVQKPSLSEMKIGYLPIPQPLLVAKEKGFFDAEGLQVYLIEFPTANASLEAIARGDVEGNGSIAYLTLFSFELASPGTLTTYFSAYETEENSWSQLVVKKDGGINELKDLVRKTIVMRSGLSSKLQADAVLKGMKIDPSTVTYIQVNPELLISTFNSPEVDAFLDIQPFGTQLLQQQLGTLFVDHPRATYIQNPYPLAAGVLSLSFVREHPEETKRFVRAIDRAIEFIDKQEKEARETYTVYLKLDPSVAQAMPLFKNVPSQQTDRRQIEALADWAVTYGLLKEKPNLQTFFLE